MIRGILTAAGLALLAAAPATTQTPMLTGATGAVAAQILAAHNYERALVGHPALVWDQELADHAAAYGPVLGRLGDLKHSPRESRPGERENLAMAWHGTMNAAQIVGLWADEKKLMQPGLFPAVSRSGNWEDVGHYTQMVWPTTTHVGCAIYSTNWDYLICRYTPPGNQEGKPVFVAEARAPYHTASVAMTTAAYASR
jgi:cysteine-rich secretory family protein